MYKVMMVDDDPTSLAIGKALLEGKYELTEARSGVQALGFLNGKYLPDLILLDITMPGLGGVDVLKAMKVSDRLQEIPVIFLTGSSHAEEELNCYQHGASDFLEKPVDPELLKLKLQRQVHYLELKRENERLKRNLGLLKERFLELFPAEE